MLGGWLGAWTAGAACATSGRRRAAIFAGTVLLPVAAALLFSQHNKIPEAMALQRALGAICLAWGGWEMFLMLPGMNLARPAKGELDGQ
jgi:threonine/homoserine/homoserine lactone efflux protein